MASMRVCASCNRPNGPHFTRCISCGHWLGQAPPEDGGPADRTDAIRRATRLLEGMTPARRRLLPRGFLHAVQMQSRGMAAAQDSSGDHQAPAEDDEDKITTGDHPRVRPPSTLGPSLRKGRPKPVAVTRDGRRIVPPSTGRMRAVSTKELRTALDPPSSPALEASMPPSEAKSRVIQTGVRLPSMRVVSRPSMTATRRHRALSIPEAGPLDTNNSLRRSLDLPMDIDPPTVGAPTFANPEADDRPDDAFSLDVALPAAGEFESDRPGPLWEVSTSMRAVVAFAGEVDENAPTQPISVLDDFPDLLNDDLWGGAFVGSDVQPGELVQWSSDPMMMSLSSGRGPFGNRDAQFRLFLLPSSVYAPRGNTLHVALQESIGMDLYTARRMLKTPLPMLLTSGDDPRKMNDQARDLRLAGAEVIMVERGYWLEGILPLRVRSLAGHAPGPVTFLMEDGTRETAPRERFGYCTIGAIDNRQGRTTWVLDLYLADAPVCLRVRSDRLDFSILGPGAPTPMKDRMIRLVEWLSPDPTTPIGLDDGFKHVSPASRTVNTASPNIEPGLVDFTEYSLLCDQGRRIG